MAPALRGAARARRGSRSSCRPSCWPFGLNVAVKHGRRAAGRRRTPHLISAPPARRSPRMPRPPRRRGRDRRAGAGARAGRVAAAAMAASRVYLGVHHGSDIAAGSRSARSPAAPTPCGALMASLEVGIVGLPNVGKTTLFNALTESGAAVTSFAAVKTSANVGVASVPDERIALLAAVGADRCPHRRVRRRLRSERGAGASDGLGGEYLGHLRTTDALTHVVRCFADDAVAHVDGRVDPVADAETVDLELLLADQALVERRRERVSKAARVGEKSARDDLATLERLMAHLDEGAPGQRVRRRAAGRARPADAQADDLRRERRRGRRRRASRRAYRLRQRARRRGRRGRRSLRGRARRARRRRRARGVPARPRPRRAGHAAARACLLSRARADLVLHRRADGGARLDRAGGLDARSRPPARSTRTSHAGSSAPR